MNVSQHTLEANLLRIKACIVRAAEKSGRRAEDVTLVAATKTQSAETIRMAYAAGIRHFGENRIQEWEEKRPLLDDLHATWHFIGHLQRNKVSRALRLFQNLDSIHSASLARRINEGSPANQRLSVLIEVRMDPVASKSGAEQDELPAIADEILSAASRLARADVHSTFFR